MTLTGGTDELDSRLGAPGAGRVTALGDVWRIELARGLRRLESGRYEEAERYFVRAYRRRPGQAEVCFALGRERLRQERFAEAEALLRVAWDRDRSMSGAAAGLARCLGIGLERFFEAYEVLDIAEARAPGDLGLKVVRSELLLEEGRGAEARLVIEAARDRLANVPQPSPAIVQAINTGLARAHNLEGIELGREGKPEQALFAFKRAADLDPSWSGPVVNMGVAFTQLGRQARALSCYERALVKDPDSTIALFNLGTLARETGQLPRAEAAYRAVLDADATYPGARLGLARVLLDRSEPREALEILKEEMAISPDEPEVWTELALAYLAVGDISHGETYLRGALALEKQYAPALCELARLLVREGRASEADLVARRAHAANGAMARDLLGILGRPSEQRPA